ncbi:hypothetical protein H2O64_04405 [Kordia sp. YSTF-M3]|uniref:Amidase domain-containing protein n=1 Tax=Kordia aestuariivivens TaxID=2759037 RepID=A0ABR7Q5Q4_9FLAO|nr:hypothetical protein [Kordia aestuariivivens]MBC8753899.1 hypothetical protein [Kordia aestuariivivens]
MQSKTKSSIKLPQSLSLKIETNTEPSDKLSRSLIFENYEGRRIELGFKLRKTASNTLEISEFTDTTHSLQVLGSLNHRSYWDKIYLRNNSGTSEIDIKKMCFTIHYHRVVSGAVKDIAMLSKTRINKKLPANSGELLLTPYIEKHLLKHAGLHRGFHHQVAKLAVKDIGKSGTSDKGYDEYGDNPKYRGWISYECSEFVSWYLHETDCWKDLNHQPNTVFRDITFTGELHTIFKAASKTYYYHSGKKKFINEVTGVEYVPKAGDPLLRRGNGKFEHAMILLKWNPKSLTTTVIDGPYPVCIRTVDIDALETRTNDPKDFIVCELEPKRYTAVIRKGSIRSAVKK